MSLDQWIMCGFAFLYVGREVVVLACGPIPGRRPRRRTWADDQ